MSAIKQVPLFRAHLVIRGKIKCETGLHIGGSKEKLEIGGVDSIVVRSPRTDYPYIPGSSIKGKIRHLVEYVTGAVGDPIIVKQENNTDEAQRIQANLGNVSKAEEIVRIFGIGANEREGDASMKFIGLTRLAVRDAFPDAPTIDMWKNDLGSDANFTEYKAENTIDRLTSEPNPRFIERVVEGSVFDFEMVYSLYQMEADEDYAAKANHDLSLLLMGLRLLENVGLGKSGSRGYGKVSIHLAPPTWLDKEAYQSDNGKWVDSKKPLPEDINDLAPLYDVPNNWFQYTA